MEDRFIGIEPKPRKKLGLALAGGGFRAALFHLGVLHRLAEFDLLRRVEVLSTVSGGSIIGALYAILLKRELEKPSNNGNLTREKYVELVDELDRVLVKGIRKNLRTLLFVNPFGVLRVLLTRDSLSRRMARLYERYLFKTLVRELHEADRSPLSRRGAGGRLALSDIHISPPGLPEGSFDIDEYNDSRLARNESVITALVFNATSLNSGARFWFSGAEIGDWYLGHIRRNELPALMERKRLLAYFDDGGRRKKDAVPELEARAYAPDPARAASLVRWWHQYRYGPPGDGRRLPAEWSGIFPEEDPGRLAEADLGELRQAWRAARRLLEVPATDPSRRRSALGRLLETIAVMDGELKKGLTSSCTTDQSATNLAEFIIELYRTRTAEKISSSVDREWDNLTIADAVGASACFPPVFPPYTLQGLYDDAVAARIALTDGGVYDNMGITALLDEGCTEIIASDTGGLFVRENEGPAGHIPLMLRLPGVFMKALAGIQRLQLRERRRTSRAIAKAIDRTAADLEELAEFEAVRKLDGLVYFHIDSPIIAAREPDSTNPEKPLPLELEPRPHDLAEIRTDLDAFNDIEVAALVNHGYDLADRYLRHYPVSGLCSTDDVQTPKPDVTGAYAGRVLRAGKSRFFRYLRVGSPLSLALTGLALIGLPFVVLWGGLSVGGVASAIRDGQRFWAGLIYSLLHLLLGPTAESLRAATKAFMEALSAGPVALAVVCTLLMLPMATLGVRAVLFKPQRARDVNRPARPKSTVQKLMSGVWSWKWNLLWLIMALPILIAAASFLIFGCAWARCQVGLRDKPFPS